MTKKYQCAHCNEDFKDGEFVAISKNEMYHNLYIRRSEALLDCMSKKALKTRDALITNKKIYFENKLYDLNSLRRIQTKNNGPRINFNDAKTGDKLIGNLEGLKRGLLKRIFSSQ